MAKFLLFVIYAAFIGLGLPDSLFGTAWPAIYSDFSLPISYGSFVASTAAFGTIISSLMSGWLLNKLGTAKVTALSTLLSAVSLIGFSFSKSVWFMMLLSLPVGFGGGAIDVALNNYVALHYSAKQMSFLHCFYGVGVSVSPYILSLVISGEGGWRVGYRLTFFILLAIGILILASLPVWKRVNKNEGVGDVSASPRLSIPKTLKIPGVKFMCAVFFLTCTIECSVSGWGSTFLVEYKNMATNDAATVITFYFVGMTLGRFLSGVAASKLHPWKIIAIGNAVLAVALILVAIPAPVFLTSVGLFMIGLGNGPMFPNFNYLAPECFGKEASESVMGVQMAFAYVGILVGPLLCGILGQNFGMFIFPIYVIGASIPMVVIGAFAKRLLDKNKSE